MTQAVPERVTGTRCNYMVDGAPMSFPCTLAQGHTEWGEPHYAVEVGRSVRAWQAWNAERAAKIVVPPEHPETAEAVARLGAFHAPPPEDDTPEISPETQAKIAESRKQYQDCGLSCSTYGGHTRDAQCILVQQVNAALAQQEHRGATLLYTEEPSDIEAVRIAPTKIRDGDQVIPTGDESQPDIQTLLIADVHERRRVGIERYGQGLRTFNGRDTLLDTYEEALDLTTYLRSLLEMQRVDRDRMRAVIRQEVVEVLAPVFGQVTAQHLCEGLAERVTTRIIDAFAFPGTAPQEVVEALDQITTSRISPEARIGAGNVIRRWLGLSDASQ